MTGFALTTHKHATGLHRRVWATILVVAGLALVMALGACGSSTSSTSTSAASGSAAAASTPMVIGISLPLTGDFSQPGGQAKAGYEAWASMVNASGGLLGRQVQLKIYDDASSQDTVTTDYTKLITQDKVDFVLGTFSTLLNYPASAVAEKNGYVFIEGAGGGRTLFEQGFHYLIFAQQVVADLQGDQFVSWVQSLPAAQRPKTAAYPSLDDPFAKPVVDKMQAGLEALGVKTVYTTVYPAATTNFQTVASAIAAKKPDLIAQGCAFEDGVGLIRALEQLKYSPKMMFQTSAPAEASQYAKAIGEANTQGIWYAVSWTYDVKTPLNPEFEAEYAKLNGGAQATENAADAFASSQVLQAAVEAVGKVDQAAIADWLHANSVQTILGMLKWDASGAPTSGEYILSQWQNGKSEVVLPANAATTTTVINPKPPWK